MAISHHCHKHSIHDGLFQLAVNQTMREVLSCDLQEAKTILGKSLTHLVFVGQEIFRARLKILLKFASELLELGLWNVWAAVCLAFDDLGGAKRIADRVVVSVDSDDVCLGEEFAVFVGDIK
jgi:hypothetical protein